MKRIIDIIKKPGEAIRLAKKEKDMGKTSLVLIEEWIITAIAVFILAVRFGSIGSIGGGAAAATLFFGGIVTTIVLGYLLKIAMNTLGARGSFYDGLTAVTYSIMPLAIGALISAILSYVPILGVMISFLIMAVLGVMGSALLYRAAKEMFATDMITALVGISVLILGLMLAFYISVITGLVGLSGLVPGIEQQLTAGLQSGALASPV